MILIEFSISSLCGLVKFCDGVILLNKENIGSRCYYIEKIKVAIEVSLKL